MNTKKQRFNQCLEQARLIVSKYRSMAPDGCDPQNTWVSTGVMVASAATSAYMGMKSAKEAKKTAGQAGTPLNLGNIQSNAINSNTANLDSILKLAGKTDEFNFGQATDYAGKLNSFNYDQLHGLLKKALPGYQGFISKSTSITNDWLKGVIPQDVTDQVKRDTAQQSLFGGFGGSRLAQNLTARDLGMTSMKLQEMGMNSAQRWIQVANQYLMPKQVTPDLSNVLFDPSQLFVNPNQAAGVAQQNSQLDYTRDMGQMQAQQQGNAALASGIGGAASALGSGYAGMGNKGWDLNANYGGQATQYNKATGQTMNVPRAYQSNFGA